MDVRNADGKIQDFLTVHTTLRLQPTYFVDRRCTASWHLGERELPFHDLTRVLSGRCTYWVDGVRMDACAGDFLYLPKGVERRAVTDPVDPMHCLAVNFDCLDAGGQALRLPLPGCFHVPADAELEALYNRMQQAWMDRGQGGWLEAEGVLYLLIGRLFRLLTHPGASGRIAARVARVCATIQHRYAEPLTVEGLAAEEGLHPVYFGQMFKAHAGVSVREHILRVRVYKAAELLATGGYSVAEAAQRCGFPDPYHFSRVFRRLCGVAPSLWRGGETPPEPGGFI